MKTNNLSVQQRYAIDQYNLCANWLGVQPGYNDLGRTLFEEIIHREKQHIDEADELHRRVRELNHDLF